MTVEELKKFALDAQYHLVFDVLHKVDTFEPQQKFLCSELELEYTSGKMDKHFPTRLWSFVNTNADVIAPVIKDLPSPAQKTQQKRLITFIWSVLVLCVLGLLGVWYANLPNEPTKQPTVQTKPDSNNTKPQEPKQEQPKQVPTEPNKINPTQEKPKTTEEPTEEEVGKEIPLTFCTVENGKTKPLPNFTFEFDNRTYITNVQGEGKVRILKNKEYNLVYNGKNVTFDYQSSPEIIVQ